MRGLWLWGWLLGRGLESGVGKLGISQKWGPWEKGCVVVEYRTDEVQWLRLGV